MLGNTTPRSHNLGPKTILKNIGLDMITKSQILFVLTVAVKYYPLKPLAQLWDYTRLFVLVPIAALRFAFKENNFRVLRNSLREVI